MISEHSTTQPDVISWESILRREENWRTQRKTLRIRLRSTETHPTYEPNQDCTRVAEVGGVDDDCYAILLKEECPYI